MGQNMMQNEAPMQQNSTPTPPPMSEEKVREGKKNSIFVFIVLILAVIVAAVLISKSSQVNTEVDNMQINTGDTMEVEVLDDNASSELSDIQADLDAMTIDDLDQDLQ